MDVVGCGGCGGIGGGIGTSLIIGSRLCSSIMYSCFKVRGWWIGHTF